VRALVGLLLAAAGVATWALPQDPPRVEGRHVRAARRSPSRVPLVSALFRDPRSAEVLVCAHRGHGTGAPENSLDAIRAAAALGVDMVEVDVRETSDGALVLMHDPVVDRTASGGHGRVSHMALAEVKALRLRDAPGEAPPTLAEALAAARGRVLLQLDLKTDRVDLVAREVAAADAFDRVCFGAWSFEKLAALRRLDARAAVIPRITSLSELEAALAPALAPVAVQIPPEIVRPEVVRRVRAAGARLWLNALWGRDILAAHGMASYWPLIEGGADIIQSDDPALVVPLAREASRVRYR
jgi:glycerophosphoryl diester phosphodiesterase